MVDRPPEYAERDPNRAFISKHRRAAAEQPTSNVSLLDLPDELLSDIFQTVDAIKRQAAVRHRASTLPLLSLSLDRRLYRLIKPICFHSRDVSASRYSS
ncbi:hypothetical protein JCM11641_001923 [Rhodosporidiobolus odoratus]